MTVFNKVRGWIGTLFALDVDGPQLGRNGTEERIKVLDSGQTVTTAAIDGTANAAYANVAGADPVALQDFVTKKFADATYAGASFSARTVEIPFTDTNLSSTLSSTLDIPANATIHRVAVRIDTPFADDADLSVGDDSTGLTAYAAPADTRLDKAGTYIMPQYTDYAGGGPDKFKVTIGAGGAGAAAGTVLIEFSVPTA